MFHGCGIVGVGNGGWRIVDGRYIVSRSMVGLIQGSCPQDIPFNKSVVEEFIPPVTDARALSIPQQKYVIIMDIVWVNIVKDKLR